MNAEEAFFDTNILLYLLSDDAAKATRTEQLVTLGGVVSVQVLNEFAVVARRKFRRDWNAIDAVLAQFRRELRVEPLTLETHSRGLELARRFGLAVYDAMIVAAAERAGCKIQYSEDMRDGLVIGKLALCNPYARR